MRVPKDAQQQVTRPDVVVPQPVGLLRGVPQRPLACAAERNAVRGRNRSHRRVQKVGLDWDWALRVSSLPQALQRDVRSGEKLASRFVAGADQPEEEMLGLYRLAAEPKGFIAGEEQRASGALIVAIEHPSSPASLSSVR